MNHPTRPKPNLSRSNVIKHRRVSQKRSRTFAYSNKKGAHSFLLYLVSTEWARRANDPNYKHFSVAFQSCIWPSREGRAAAALRRALGAFYMVPASALLPKVLFVFECVRAHAGWFSLLHLLLPLPFSAAFRSLVRHLWRKESGLEATYGE